MTRWIESLKRNALQLNRAATAHVDDYPEHERFFILALTYIGILSGISHVGLASLYIASGIAPIAIYELGSVLIWAVTYWLISRGYPVAAVTLGYVEVLCSSTVIIYFLGSSTLPHLPVLIVSGVAFFLPKRLRLFSWLYVMLVLAAFLGLHEFSLSHTPSFHLSPLAAKLWILHNVGFTVVMLAVLVAIFAHVAEAAMIEVKVQRDRADDLLLNVLPLPVAERLKAGETTIADGIENASVVFADLVGFTELAGRQSPHALVDLLNELFSRFDGCLEAHGLEKIKTIGDAYMAAAGVMHADPKHAHHCVEFAQSMLRVVAELNAQRGLNLQFRVGIASGPLVAAVVGKRKFIYDLWGDTVNTASRMETGSEAGRINVAATTYDLIRNDFACEYRGKVSAKGKGEVDMYFVVGEEATQ